MPQNRGRAAEGDEQVAARVGVHEQAARNIGRYPLSISKTRVSAAFLLAKQAGDIGGADILAALGTDIDAAPPGKQQAKGDGPEEDRRRKCKNSECYS